MYYVAREENGIIEEDYYEHSFGEAVNLRHRLTQYDANDTWVIYRDNGDGQWFEVNDDGEEVDTENPGIVDQVKY